MNTFYINKVILEGIIGRPPEIIKQKKVTICRFHLFTKEQWLSKGGDTMGKNNWFTVDVIGKYAEGMAETLKEGMTCFIEGYIKYETGPMAGMIKVIASKIREIIKPAESNWINNVIIAGKISSDISDKVLGSGTKLCYFTLSFTENWKNSDGRRVQKKNWVKVEVLGGNVDRYRQDLKKDMWILVDGFLRYEKFMEDKSIVKVRAFSLQSLQ